MKFFKNNRLIKNSSTIVFMGALVVNCILFFVIPKEKIDTIENKEKLVFPDYHTSGISSFMKNYEAYFTNHFPYKYSYIKTLNYIKKDVLKSFNANDRVIIGKNNWLFYNAASYDKLGLNEYYGFNQWNQDQIQKIISNVNAIKSFCKKNNIQFQILICPSKHTVYNEYLPTNYLKKQDNCYDQFIQTFPEYINLKQTLLDFKKTSNKLLYYKTDTHWNFLGGVLAGQELSKKIQPFFPNIAVFTNISIKDSVTNSGYDLANMLALKNFYVDTFYQIGFNEKITKKIPHLLIVHDSFIEAINPCLNQLFDKVTQRHLFDEGIPSPEILLKEKPDVFIIELVERYKDVLLGDIHPDYFK